MRSSSSARQAASLSFPAHGLDRQQHLLAVRPHAERDEKRDRGRLPVEPNARDSAVEDQPDDRLLGERAPIPGIPIGLHLAPGPADHVLADRPGERRGKRPPHPAGVGSRKIGPGDQRVGGPGAALIGRKRGAPPFARLAGLARQPSARHGDPRLDERARQRPFAMAVADPDKRRHAFVLACLTPPAARTRKRLAQFLLQHRLDKTAHAGADPVLDRVDRDRTAARVAPSAFARYIRSHESVIAAENSAHADRRSEGSSARIRLAKRGAKHVARALHAFVVDRMPAVPNGRRHGVRHCAGA